MRGQSRIAARRPGSTAHRCTPTGIDSAPPTLCGANSAPLHAESNAQLTPHGFPSEVSASYPGPLDDASGTRESTSHALCGVKSASPTPRGVKSASPTPCGVKSASQLAGSDAKLTPHRNRMRTDPAPKPDAKVTPPATRGQKCVAHAMRGQKYTVASGIGCGSDPAPKPDAELTPHRNRMRK